jgi:hypothetical protein
MAICTTTGTADEAVAGNDESVPADESLSTANAEEADVLFRDCGSYI